MELGSIKVYRMTHIQNIPHILKNGITHKSSSKANKDYVNIGDISLIDTRQNKTVSIDNGDLLNYGAPTIVLGNFVPFYFGIKMPMLYVIQNGGNFVEKPTPAKDIIYLVCSVNKIIQTHKDYFFSDGHATDNLTSFYDKSKIDNLSAIIDWESVKAPFWGGQENLNIKRKKQAEFLVSEDISPDYIIGYGCYNEIARDNLLSLGVDGNKIKIIPQAYYK